ncbi:MAG: PilZ domain-containing protein [Desulfobacterales bacterium]
MGDQQSASTFAEKRKHRRIDTSNDVDYILLNEQREKADEGKGRTINLSQSGALLETQKPLNGPFIILMTMDLDGNQVQVKGRVANTRQSERPGLYLTGIRFTGSKKEHINAIVAFVRTYNRRKYSEQNKETNQPADR